jgi:Flp pilus assembly protein TadB
MTAAWLAVALAVLVAPPAGRRTGDPAASGAAGHSIALALDLAAAALSSGQSLPVALSLAAPAAGPDVATALEQVARLGELGADPDQAWAQMPRDGPLGEVRRVAVRSASSGLRLAAGFERLARDIRACEAAAAAARAQRAGVFAMGPLAACFLPAFVCLGIVPVVVGVARSAIGVPP